MYMLFLSRFGIATSQLQRRSSFSISCQVFNLSSREAVRNRVPCRLRQRLSVLLDFNLGIRRGDGMNTSSLNLLSDHRTMRSHCTTAICQHTGFSGSGSLTLPERHHVDASHELTGCGATLGPRRDGRIPDEQL